MLDSFIRGEVSQGIARLVLDRPQKRNALTRAMLRRMDHILRSWWEDESVRLIVLSATGPAFCAGMDLKEMQQRAQAADPAAEWEEDARAYHDVLIALVQARMPTMAVVQGPAVAGGVGLLLACDIVVAGESAFFALPEPQRGITAAVVTPLLTDRVGLGWASYLLLSGRRVSAEEAWRMGLCHEVVADAELSAREAELATSILTGGPEALARTKSALRELAVGPLAERLKRGMVLSAAARETAEAQEGLAAFLAGTDPTWRASR